MAGDRQAILIKRAAASGVVDFKEAKLLDRRWWLRLRWLLEELETDECRQFIQLQTIKQAGALNYLSGKQAFDHHWKQLNELMTHWTSLSFPWLSKTTKQNSDYLLKRWLRAHKLKTLDSDEARQKIKAFSDELTARQNSNSPVADESSFGSWCK